MKQEISSVADELDIQSYGLYEPKYDFKDSAGYAGRLKAIRSRQKDEIKNRTACQCDTEWTVGESKAKGKQMIDRNTKLMLRAFNGESDALIMKVRHNNIESITKRIYTLQRVINSLGKPLHCYITDKYVDLKIEELDLCFEYEEKKQEEKEEQRAIKERIREEQRAIKEAERATREAEKEQLMAEKMLEKARSQLKKDQALTDEKMKMLNEQVASLEQRLMEAQAKGQRAKSMAEITRSGYVYVVSNRGSFGEGVFKVGMTRRLEPMDRVRELSGAAVPFPYDVHAMIYSQDAPSLENFIHQYLRNNRVNLVNERKEFFYTTIDEIEATCKHAGVDYAFTKTALARQYQESELKRTQSANH